MKTVLTGFLLLVSLYVLSQKKNSVIDTCSKAKPLPCKETNTQSVEIDTIESSKFGILIDKLYKKMRTTQKLSIEEDRDLVFLMNTINWAQLNNQEKIKVTYPKLHAIKKFFDKTYQKALTCKYQVCLGSGVSSYFIELKVQYMGNPFACSRYFVRR